MLAVASPEARRNLRAYNQAMDILRKDFQEYLADVERAKRIIYRYYH